MTRDHLVSLLDIFDIYVTLLCLWFLLLTFESRKKSFLYFTLLFFGISAILSSLIVLYN